MAEKVGVYVCHCGSNIAGKIDVPEVAKWWGRCRIGAQGTDGFAEVLTNGGWRAVTKDGAGSGEGAMNYELYMGEALAEAQLARSLGERPSAAVAVVDEAMVARSHERVVETSDPTAHAVVMALREAARKLGPDRMGEATIFATHEPCPMCVGALLECDVETLVFAVPDPVEGAAGTVIQLAQSDTLPRRMKVISGIRRDEAEELLAGVEQGG